MFLNHKRQGYTLIELSIVLVVVGLVVGGVMTGQSMIRGAQINAVATEVAEYQQAVHDFKDRYGALPGDMSNAEDQWGADGSCPDTAYTASPHKTTCDGDGDGRVGYFTPGGAAASVDREGVRLWQQLTNAGFLKGAYTGVAGSNNSRHILAGVNAPASQLSGATYILYFVDSPAGDTGAGYWPALGHVLFFGSQVTNSWPYGAALTPIEAQGLDSKIDDGAPGYGKVMTFTPVGVWANCATSSTRATAAYDVANGNIACAMQFIMDF